MVEKINFALNAADQSKESKLTAAHLVFARGVKDKKG
jgi:hypothetical protein